MPASLSGSRGFAAALFIATLLVPFRATNAEQLPASLRGTWRIERILPTTNQGCWAPHEAASLVGSTLTYSQNEMRWRGGVVRLDDIFTRQVSARQFSNENAGPEHPASFEQLGILGEVVTEVDMQHSDAAVLPASTEIPGDAVMIVGPDRIVVSACGVYFDAVRPSPRRHGAQRALSSSVTGTRAQGTRSSGR